MRVSTALLILCLGFCFHFITGCGGKQENIVIENPPMSEEENREEESAGISAES